MVFAFLDTWPDEPHLANTYEHEFFGPMTAISHAALGLLHGVRLLQLDQPDQPSFLRAYLFKIAANVASDVVRRRTVRNACDYADVPDVGNPATQEKALAARQQLKIATAALQELPPKCREAFVLSRHDGRSTAEIAVKLGVSDRMVRLYLVRAIEHVQAALGT